MLGLSNWKAGELDGAEDSFLTALELKPEHLKSLVNYSRVLIEQGRDEEAQAQIEMAMAVNPESMDAARVLGRIQHNLGQLSDAEATYREVLTTHENDVWALNNLGLVLIEQDRHLEAMAPLAKAVRLNSDIACIHNNLGIALERAGQFTVAKEVFAQALTADDQYTKAQVSLDRVENLIEAEGTVPVDLAALADNFQAVPLQLEVEADMEVASALDSTTPENDKPE